MKGCKHPARYRCSLRWGAVVRDGVETRAITETPVNICALCMEWLPLGPANDGGEHAASVAVEKLALDWLDYTPFEESDCCCSGCQKRHLANTIATHGINEAEEG